MGVRRLLRWIPILLVLGLRAAAQVDQFLPEIGLYYKPAADVRLTFQAKETREGGDPVQAELGPSVDFYLKPLIRLRMITKYEVDDSKKRPLVFSIGYRYLPSPNTATVNRLEPVITSHFSLTKFLLSDRNRADLDWKDGKFTWRYRNQFQVERRMTIHSYHPGPYATAEFLYESP